MADGMALLREEKDRAYRRPLTAEEALKLRNDFAREQHQKILARPRRAAAGRAQGVNYEREDGPPRRRRSQQHQSPVHQQRHRWREFVDLTGLAIMSFDRQLKNFAPKDVVVSWQTSEDGHDRPLRASGRHHLVRRQAVHRLRRRVHLQADHVRPRAAGDPAVRGSGTDKIKAIKAYDDHTSSSSTKKPLGDERHEHQLPDPARSTSTRSRSSEDPSLKRQLPHRARSEAGHRRAATSTSAANGARSSSSAAARATTCTTASRFATSRTSLKSA